MLTPGGYRINCRGDRALSRDPFWKPPLETTGDLVLKGSPVLQISRHILTYLIDLGSGIWDPVSGIRDLGSGQNIRARPPTGGGGGKLQLQSLLQKTVRGLRRDIFLSPSKENLDSILTLSPKDKPLSGADNPVGW
jgi:hypothetical protein